MRQRITRMLLWLPRILGIAFALFLSIFALDVFGVGYSVWETVVALFMHLIPSFLLLIAVALAWRREWIGAVVFLAFSVWYLSSFQGLFAWSAFLLIAGPPFVIGMLYLFNWLYMPKLLAHV